MNRVAVVGDTHFGAKAESQVIKNIQKKFWEEVFWPAIDAAGNIEHIVHEGDLMDRRKYVNYDILNFAKEQFFEPARKRGINVHWAIGNHDAFRLNTLELNAYEAFKEYKNVTAYTTATEVELYGKKVLLMPWICDDNFRDSFQKLVDFDGAAVIGHLEFYGFEMHKGMPNNHGFITDPFKHVPIVMTGHYHHKSTKGNINYLGSPFEMTWSDYDDTRGFHWWYPESNKLELVENPHNLFYSFVYDDAGKDASYVKTMLDLMKSKDLNQKIVKIIVKSKSQPLWYDSFCDAALKLGAFDLVFIDDTAWNTEIDSSAVVDGEKSLDSLAMIKWYVSEQPWANKEIEQSVTDLMEELYTEACDITKSGVRT